MSKDATPQMQEILDVYESFSALPIESLSPENARNLPPFSAAVEGVIGKHVLKRAMPFPEAVETVRHIAIPTREGSLIARVYHPLDVFGESLPVVLYFHGGGWVLANLDVYDDSCRALANESSSIVVSVGYRQSPEHRFPSALNDAFAAYQWLRNHAMEIGGDPACIAVAGESAGGNLAAVVCLRAREDGIPQPVHQLLVYPVTDLTFAGESHQEHADAKPLNEAMLHWFRRHYLGDLGESTNPEASPLLARSHAGLAPATIILAELDPLFSDGESYAKKLAEDGVAVKVKTYCGVTHEFFGAKTVLDESKAAIAFAAEQLSAAFAGRSGEDEIDRGEFARGYLDPPAPALF